MGSVEYLTFFVITFLSMGTFSGYIIKPVESRSFGLFNFFPNGNRYDIFSRIASFETSLNQIMNQLAQESIPANSPSLTLENYIATLAQNQEALEKEISTLRNTYLNSSFEFGKFKIGNEFQLKSLEKTQKDLQKNFRSINANNFDSSNHSTALNNLLGNYNTLRREVPTSLSQRLEALEKKSICPPTVTYGIVIGIFCYTVTATPTAFPDALITCQVKGGTLAQPAPNPTLSKAFYAALKAKFPSNFRTIESATENAGTFWIGYQQLNIGSSNPFAALDGTGLQASATNKIFNPAVGQTSQRLAATIFNQGVNWKALDMQIAPLPFICQYNLV